MRNLFIIFIFIGVIFGLAGQALGQATNFEDGFEDGNFTENPIWNGDTNDFSVVEDSPNHLLQLDVGDSGSSFLSTPSSNINGNWKFYIDFRGFEPSGSNQTTIFLMSDVENLASSVNGYAVQIGESGNDVFHLMRFDDGDKTTILSDTTVIADNGGGYTVNVSRDQNGNWQMAIGKGYGGPLYNSRNMVTDTTYSSVSCFGLRVDYTSSRADKFYFDFKIDLPPFTITKASVGNNRVDVAFNRPFDKTTVQASDFELSDLGAPASVSFPSATIVRLNYDTDLPSGKYTLNAQNIEDQSGNLIADNAAASFIIFGKFVKGDIIINEFMADPPDGQAEYVEIKNRSDKFFNLQNWQIGDATGADVISYNTLALQPNALLVISSDTTVLSDTYGNRPYVQPTYVPSLNNSGDVIKILTADSMRVDSLQYDASWGGDNVALERRSETVASTYKENFGNSPDSLRGTPGLANEVAKDTEPPDLTGLNISDNQTINMGFSERLDDQKARNAENYSINGASIQKALHVSADSVQLQLAQPLKNAHNYRLSVTNQQDIFGNSTSFDTTFTYYKPVPADSGDIFINEFMYDPPEGSSEYIELYNPTSKSFDLNGWTINDNTGQKRKITNKRFIVAPDNFVVIAADSSLLDSVSGISFVSMGINFPSLNNSGDAIALSDANGVQLDSLLYTESWGGENIALERRTVGVSPVQANFGESPNGFGTPGQINQITEDKSPPQIVDFSIADSRTLTFIFSESLNQNVAINTTHYSISDGLNVQSAKLFGPDTVHVHLSGAMQNDTKYTISVEGLKDIFGNAMTRSDTSFTYYKISPADSGDVFINEFMYDPPDSSTEYVELYNASDKSLDLRNWTINDNTGRRRVITRNQFILPPDSIAIIAPDQTLLQQYSGILLAAMGSNFPSLNNSGDAIVLRNAAGQHLDSLNYDKSWGGNEIAVERRTVDAAPIQPNFGEAPNGFGTPGSANQIPEDKTPPQLENLFIINHEIKLFYSEKMDNKNAVKTDNYSLNPKIKINNAIQTADDSVQLSLASNLKNNTIYHLTVKNQKDVFGNAAGLIDSSFTFYKISAPDSGDIFFNEFMYDPPGGSTEYIELYNASEKSLNLQNWTINDNTGKSQIISKNPCIIPPAHFAVIAPDQTLLQKFSNLPLVTMGSRFPSLNNSGDDIVLRDSTGQRLDSLRYSSAWGGDKIALERRTISIYPVEPNFGDAPNGFGTPGSANKISPDKTPPILTSFSVLSAKSLEFVFSEKLQTKSVNNIKNYAISGDTRINSVSVSDDTVQIGLSKPLKNNERYTVSVQNISDLFRNEISKTDTTFTFYEVSSVDFGDVFINEFMYNPPAGKTEYVELYNHSQKSLNLKKWTINDNTGHRQFITKSAYILPPDDFVVIAPDNTILEDYPDAKIIVMSNRFPSLNNSGDDIVVRDSAGQRLDSLRYTKSWGGTEVALERRTVDVAPVMANFGEALNGFGTPGAANEIRPDSKAPVLEKLQILDKFTIRLLFSEPIIAQTATDQMNYAITPARNIQLISAIKDTVTLYLSQPLQSGQNYSVSVQGLQDIFGNTISEISQDIAFIQYSEAQTGNIVINEFLCNSGDTNNPEFVELYNPTTKNFDLTGWKIGDARSSTTIGTKTTLPADSYLILTGKTNLANSLPNTAYLSGFPSLNNDEDAIYLQDNHGITIDSLFYRANTFGGNIDGKSAERKDPLAASNDPANFATSTAENGYTPGAKNSVFAPDETPPTIKFAQFLENGKIEVQFNEFISQNNDLKFSINNQPLTFINFDSTNASTLTLQTPNNISTATQLTLKVANLTDIRGNITPSTGISIARPAAKGNVVINEIMYDPISDSEDNQPDQSEYIELRNTQDYAVSLEGITLHDAPDEHGKITELIPVSTAEKFIPAQGTALIYAGESVDFNKCRIATFFSLSDENKNSLIRVNKSTLGLASEDDAVYLAAENGNTIDSVYYDESWQNPNLLDTKGIALERINPDEPSNDVSNWGSSTDERGGTPNKENAIYQNPNSKLQQNIGIEFSPNPFSPDGDGHDDRLFINYKLDRSNYLITVLIYDRYGRLVRKLTDSKPAGFSGSLIWNGLKDDGSPNRIGIYIVVFKAFDSADGKSQAFKKTVVLARRLN